jgi:3-isopropylmalate dehydratase small subunit
MGMTLIEKIIANHSKYPVVKPNDIIDIDLDIRAARDFGGANVVKNLIDNNLTVNDASKTFFTFDCNPTGSDQNYAMNQQICRLFARDHGIKVFDIDAGVGTHILIQEGMAYPGSTAVTTDSHANILGAVGAFGQGMGDQDIAAAFANGKVWFKVPESVKLNITGKKPAGLSAKDITLNLLNIFGANKLLGYSVEIYGNEIDKLTLDERITIASMGTEMGVIILLFTPNQEVLDFCSKRAGRKIETIKADKDANYAQIHDIDISKFEFMVSLPGKPHGTSAISKVQGVKIDSAFIGSCTNGRIQDLREAAEVLKGKKVAPGVVLKIVPATDEIWQQCLNEGLFKIFKDAGALISNAGCAGCAAGQVGQNGQGEVSISTGNRNFPGKQGKGEMYLASPSIVAASAVAGVITIPSNIPERPVLFTPRKDDKKANVEKKKKEISQKPTLIEGRVWYIKQDNIDTDMIYHNRYLTITNIAEMGKYTFDNLKGYEDFAKKANAGDIVIVHKNFGSGSSRQQAVDCFISLGIQAVIAESFGAIYERNAINAGFPIMTFKTLEGLDITDGDTIRTDLKSGEITNLKNGKTIKANPLFDVQIEIYQRGGIF